MSNYKTEKGVDWIILESVVWGGMSHLFVCQPNLFGSRVTGIYVLFVQYV